MTTGDKVRGRNWGEEVEGMEDQATIEDDGGRGRIVKKDEDEDEDDDEVELEVEDQDHDKDDDEDEDDDGK